MEITGLLIGFISSIVIVIGDKILQKCGFCFDEKDDFDSLDYEEMIEGK